jgi:hypothetical protein
MARDILNRSNESVGIDQRLWIIEETGYGNNATAGLFPVAADGIEHVNAMMDFKIPREDAAHRSGRSLVTRLSKKKEVTWSFESYIVPADPTGLNPNLPDMHPMLVNVFGQVDETDPSKKIYQLTRASSKSFRFLEEGTHFSRLAVGCVADSVTFTLPGDGMAMVKFEGFAQDLYTAGQSTLAADVTASTTLTVPVGHGKRFEVGSYIDIIDQADGNTRKAASKKITAVVGDTLTIEAPAVTALTDDIVIGAAPDFTASKSENALLGLKGSFTTGSLGTIDCQLLSAEIGIKNNYTPKNMIYGTDSNCGYIADKRREVTLKFDVLLTQDNYTFYVQNKTFVADSVEIVLAPQEIPAPINAPAGRTFTFRFDKVEFDVPSLEQPGDSYVKLTLEGKALAADINNPNGEFELEIS